MKRSLLFVFLFAVAACLSAGAMPADSTGAASSTAASTATGVEGVWVTADGDGWVEITRDGDVFHGAIVGPTNDGRLDDENPDPKLRSRPLFGLRILEGFKAMSDEKWADGTIYDPNNGKTYSCTLELEDEKTLKVRGFIGVSLFGRTERWTRQPTGY